MFSVLLHFWMAIAGFALAAPIFVGDECVSGFASIKTGIPGEQPLHYEFEKGNPYNHPINSAQKKFLERVGVKVEARAVSAVKPREVAFKVNELLKDAIQRGDIRQDEVLLWSEAYVGKDGRLVFVTLGEAPPPGALSLEGNHFKYKSIDERGRRIYEHASTADPDLLDAAEDGLLSTPDYYEAIAGGHFPGTFSPQAVGYQGYDLLNSPIREPAFLHDLAHIGGFVENPKGMAAFRKVMRSISKEGEKLDRDRDRKIFFVNELLPGFSVGTAERLQAFRAAGTDFEKLKPSELIESVNKLLRIHREGRAPFGGALRSGGSAVTTVRPRIELLMEAMRRHGTEYFEGMKRRELVSIQHDLRTGAEKESYGNHLRSLDGQLQEKRKQVEAAMRNYADAATHLADTSAEGWFQRAAEKGALDKESSYYKYLCAGPLANKGMLDTTIWNAFCGHPEKSFLDQFPP